MCELQPSNNTVRCGPNRTPGVAGWVSGPASTSNSARAGATPTLRRRSRSAFAVGEATGIPDRPAVSLSHTSWWPTSREQEVDPDAGGRIPQPPAQSSSLPGPRRRARMARSPSVPPDDQARTGPRPRCRMGDGRSAQAAGRNEKATELVVGPAVLADCLDQRAPWFYVRSPSIPLARPKGWVGTDAGQGGRLHVPLLADREAEAAAVRSGQDVPSTCHFRIGGDARERAAADRARLLSWRIATRLRWTTVRPAGRPCQPRDSADGHRYLVG